MKHLNANLDNTTNIEVPLLASTRVLGLDADNNIIEVSSVVGTDDIVDGDDLVGGGTVTNTICYTVTGDLDACYIIGAEGRITNNENGDVASGAITTITTTAGTGGSTTADCAGISEGDPITGEYWEWEIVDHTYGTASYAAFDHGIDALWEFPNGVRQFLLWSDYETTNITALSGTTIPRFIGRRIYGRIARDLNGIDSAAANATPVGSTWVSRRGSDEGETTLRKIKRLTTAPAPQNWVALGQNFPPYTFRYVIQNSVFPTFVAATVNGNSLGSVTAGGLTYGMQNGFYPAGDLVQFNANTTSAPANNLLIDTNVTAAVDGDGNDRLTCVAGGSLTPGDTQPTPDMHEICVVIDTITNADPTITTAVPDFAINSGVSYTFEALCAMEDITPPADINTSRICSTVFVGTRGPQNSNVDGTFYVLDVDGANPFLAAAPVGSNPLNPINFGVLTGQTFELEFDPTGLPSIIALTTSATQVAVAPGRISIESPSNYITTVGYASARLLASGNIVLGGVITNTVQNGVITDTAQAALTASVDDSNTDDDIVVGDALEICVLGEGGDLNIGGDAEIGGDLNVDGDECVSGDLKVTGDVVAEGTLCAGGTVLILGYVAGNFATAVSTGADVNGVSTPNILISFDLANTLSGLSATDVGDIIGLRNTVTNTSGLYSIAAHASDNTLLSFTRLAGDMTLPEAGNTINIHSGGVCTTGGALAPSTLMLGTNGVAFSDGTMQTTAATAGVSYTGADNTIPLSNGVNAANGFDESPITVTDGSTSFVETAITTSEAFAVPPSSSFDFSNVFTQIFIDGGIAGFAAFTDGSRIRITDGVGTVDVIYDNDEVTVPVAGIAISPIPGVDYSTAPTLDNANGAIVFTELEEVTTAGGTTVTGELTVTEGITRTGDQATGDTSTPVPSTTGVQFWSGTQAQYDALVAASEINDNTIYYTT